jgi:hypothetical protein
MWVEPGLEMTWFPCQKQKVAAMHPRQAWILQAQQMLDESSVADEANCLKGAPYPGASYGFTKCTPFLHFSSAVR